MRLPHAPQQFFTINKGDVDSPTPSLTGYIPGAGTCNGQEPSFRVYGAWGCGAWCGSQRQMWMR